MWRRAFPAFGVFAAFAGLAYPLLALMFLSQGDWEGVKLFFLYGFVFFIAVFVAPAGLYELLRMLEAKLWKEGKWLSKEERRECKSIGL